MTVNTSTFVSDIILFLKTYLTTNLTDPLSRTAGSYVLTAYPKRETQYPIVTIKNIGMNTRRLGIGSETIWVNFNVEIRAWARNAKECDTMSQDIINALRQAQYGTGGSVDNNLYGFDLQSTNSITEDNGEQNMIHSKVMNFKYAAILT